MDLKARIGLLRIFADVDEDYKTARMNLEKAITALSDQKLPQEELCVIRELMVAYASMNQRLLELACERMMFPYEIEK